MKRIILFSFFTLIIYTALAVYAVPNFYDIANHKKQAIDLLQKVSGYEVEVVEEIKFSFFPYPEFSISDVTLKNRDKFKAPYFFKGINVIARPSFSSLLLLSPRLSKVVINDAEVNFETKKNNKSSATNVSIGTNPDKNKILTIPEIIINKALIRVYKNGDLLNQVSARSIVIAKKYVAGAGIGFKAEFFPQDIPLQVEVLFGNPDFIKAILPVKAELEFANAGMIVDGKLRNWFSSPEFTGKAEFEASDIDGGLVGQHFGLEEFSEFVRRYKLALEGDLVLSESGSEFTGVAEFAGAKGKGGVRYSGDKKSGEFRVQLKEINIDRLLKDQAIVSLQNQERVEKSEKDPVMANSKSVSSKMKISFPEALFKMTKSRKLLFDIGVEKIITKGRSLENLKLSASVTDQKLGIEKLSLMLPGDSELSISGDFYNNDNGSRNDAVSNNEFILGGKISLLGAKTEEWAKLLRAEGIDIPLIKFGNFYFNSDFVFRPGELYLSGIDSLVEDLIFTGQFLFKNDNDRKKGGKEGPVYEAIIKAGQVNIDKLLELTNWEPKNVQDVKKSSEVNKDEDKNKSVAMTGATAAATTVKRIEQDKVRVNIFDKLRLAKERVKLSLEADSLIYDGERFDKFYSHIDFQNGILSLKDLYFESENFDTLKATAILNTNNLKPEVDLFLQAGKFDLQNPVINKFSKTINDFAITEVRYNNAVNYNIKPNAIRSGVWSVKPMDLSPFSLLNMRLNAKIGHLKVAELKFTDTELSGQVIDSLIKVDMFKGKVFGGDLDMKASISAIGRPSANLAFVVTNADLYHALSKTTGIKSLAGKFNLSGSVSTSGLNFNSWVAGSNGSGSFIVRDMKMLGTDLDYIGKNLNQARQEKDLEFIMKNGFSLGKTSFDYVGGHLFLNEGELDISKLMIRDRDVVKHQYTGKINFSKWTINSKLDIVYKILKDKLPFNLSFIVTGSLDNIRSKIENSSIKEYWKNILLSSTKK